jgi:hypothetical protein
MALETKIAYLKLESRALRLARMCGAADAHTARRKWERVFWFLVHRERRYS